MSEEEVTEELATLRKRLEKKVNECMQLEMSLHAEGRRLDPLKMLSIRLGLIVDAMFGDDERSRLEFEYANAEIASQVLMEANQQIIRSKLLAPGPVNLPANLRQS